MNVTEAFFSVDVKNMERGVRFYVSAFGADIVFESPGWTSLRIAGVRLALALGSDCPAGRVGLHFSVNDLQSALSAVERAGGLIASSPVEVAPGVMIVHATDTEGNTFILTATATS
jgi:predicted enzyme related to lactoylglutathione lyase